MNHFWDTTIGRKYYTNSKRSNKLWIVLKSYWIVYEWYFQWVVEMAKLAKRIVNIIDTLEFWIFHQPK